MEAASENNSYTKAILNNEKSLTQMVYRKIKEMMLSYEIVPGQRLIFSDLAKRIGESSKNGKRKSVSTKMR
jgi:DNA-binding GntR family transcriptional regulator